MNFKTLKLVRIGVIIPVLVLGLALSASADPKTLVSDIDRLMTLEGAQRDLLTDSIFNSVQADTSGVIETILPRLNAPDVSDTVLAVYIAVLGATESPQVAGDICKLYGETESYLVRRACRTVLAKIGNPEAEDCLLASLGYLINKDERFLVFDALAQLQCEEVLPLADEILESDSKEYYWRPIFVFGKMGDAAVPYLISKVNDENTDVRYNAIYVLGPLLLAPEATQPLQDQFWQEKDPVIRNLILSSVERTDANFESVISFMKEVKSRAKDKESKQYAKESIEILKKASKELEAGKAQKDISPEKFEAAYKEIWDSYGKKGDYDALSSASQLSDEARLKKLRERILLRDSDEAFYDYDHVNGIISLNRILYGQE